MSDSTYQVEVVGVNGELLDNSSGVADPVPFARYCASEDTFEVRIEGPGIRVRLERDRCTLHRRPEWPAVSGHNFCLTRPGLISLDIERGATPADAALVLALLQEAARPLPERASTFRGEGE